MIDKTYENLKKLVGKKFDGEEIICCFEDTDNYVFVDKRPGGDYYDYSAYEDTVDSKSYLFKVDENGIITDVFD